MAFNPIYRGPTGIQQAIGNLGGVQNLVSGQQNMEAQRQRMELIRQETAFRQQQEERLRQQAVLQQKAQEEAALMFSQGANNYGPTQGGGNLQPQGYGYQQMVQDVLANPTPELVAAATPYLDLAKQSQPDAPQKLMQVGPNVFDPNTKEWLTAPEKTEQKKPFDPREKLSGDNLLAYLASGGDAQKAIDLLNSSKPDKDKNKKNAGKAQVTGLLNELKNRYDELEDMEAIPNVQEGPIYNLRTSLASSELGQWIGKKVGTEEQGVRNKISQSRPLLINAIRQASEMGARGMDSETELKFYLKAATDPSLDIDSNLNALAVLDKAYGLGLGIKGGNQSGSQEDSGFKEGQTATNPKTNEKLIYRNGQWEKM